MRHQLYNPDYPFIDKPVHFDKYTPKELLQYCLGAAMYMPGTRDFYEAIVNNKYLGLTTMVMCFEDACKPEDVPEAEKNCISLLDKLLNHNNNIPLIIFRVRSLAQFIHFSELLTKEHARLICAFNFPKFGTQSGAAYYDHLRNLNNRLGEVIYGMPILEDRAVAFKESRMTELIAIKEILDANRDLVLNVRVGGTDFSACFGARRNLNNTIYDIITVNDCLQDILNVFIRDNDYIVSGPVWEYFRASRRMRFDKLPKSDFERSLIVRTPIVNPEVDGLMRELLLDNANGFIGKTIIHPTHLNYVNGMLAVTKEEYEDAKQIIDTSGGVAKSANGNKMNEVGPHRIWAEKMLMRAKAYGVIKDSKEYLNLISGESDAKG